MLTDVFHTSIENTLTVFGMSGHKARMVIAEPTDDLSREVVLEVADVVIGPSGTIINSDSSLTPLELAEFTPQDKTVAATIDAPGRTYIGGSSGDRCGALPDRTGGVIVGVSEDGG
jgi:hypothetical protein